MRKASQLVAFFLVALALFLVGLWALGWVPTYMQNIASIISTSYHVTITAIRYIGQFLDAIAPALTALATVFIGLFTATIWQVNREQIRHNRQTERAYLWPGFAGHLRSIKSSGTE